MTQETQAGKAGAIAKLTPGEKKSPQNFKLLQGLLDKPAVGVPDPVENDARIGKRKRPRVFGRLKLRHIAILVGFGAIVVVPTALATTYMAFVAADQYQSSSSFSVRSIDSAQASDILGIFSQASSGNTISDSYVLIDFIRSESMVREIDKAFGLDNVFARRGFDFYFGISPEMPIEKKLKYWRSMLNVNFDHTSGIIDLHVKSFEPQISQRLTAFVVAQSEKLINNLSLSARDEVLRVAQTEVRMAEERLSDARSALRIYRDSVQEVDPVEGAKMAAQLIGTLEQQQVQLRTELSTALTQLSENTPRVRVLRTQLESIEKQIQIERQRFGSGTAGKQGRSSNPFTDVSGRLLQYETLETDREFAERAYTSSLGGLEKARIDAGAKQRYLAVFIRPTMSEFAEYPRRILSSFIVFLAALLVWGVLVLGYYNIRDRN